MTHGAVIRFDGVSKAFGPKRVLENVTFEVRRGEAFCLLGRSGSGKSVTLRQMIGLIPPDQGEIEVLGQTVNRLGPRHLSLLRKQVGFLFQYSALFDSLTVGENVSFPLDRHTDMPPGQIREKALALLEQVGLEATFDQMPTELSGGMRKRVGLARALALDPPILLVDEPSSGLDPITSAEIDELLLDLKQRMGTTMVVVTHNIPSARRIGDVLAFLEGGRIVERGSPAELENSSNGTVRHFMSAMGGT